MDDVNVAIVERTEHLLARWRTAEHQADEAAPGSQEQADARARASDARQAFHGRVDGADEAQAAG